MPVKVALVNEPPIVTAGMRALLEPFRSDVHLEAASSDLLADDLDLVLHDSIASPDTRPFDPRLTIGERVPKLVVFSWEYRPQKVRAVLSMGAAGYLSKSAEPDELVANILRIHGGERVGLPPSQGGQRSYWPGAEHGLSEREAQVVLLVCRGVSNKEIGEQLFIGINTVKTYVRSAYRKMGVETRPQAVIWGVAHGFAAESAESAELAEIAPGGPVQPAS